MMEEDQRPQGESLSDILRSHGIQLGSGGLRPASEIPPPAPRSTFKRPIESVLDGFEDRTQAGSTFVVQNDYAVDYIHGIVSLNASHPVDVIAQWCKCTDLPTPDSGKYIFLDTETSGLSGGTGTYAFMVGLGYRIPDGFRVVQLFMRDPSQEEALLMTLDRILEPFEVIVTFNGKSFDVPILRTRHILNSIPPPFTRFAHIDMLPVARRLWRNRLPSRALKDLEVDILSLPRTDEEVPGWLIPELYYEYLKSDDALPLAGIFYHNAMDILSLAAIFNFACAILEDPLSESIAVSQANHGQAVHGLDLLAIARMYEEMGRFETALMLYEHCLQKDLPLPFFLETLQRFALLYRKRGDWPNAVLTWQKAVEHRQIDPCIELAKYFEHQRKDYDEALRWTELAISLIDANHFPLYQSRLLTQDLERRRTRLVNRLNKRLADADHAG